MTVLFLCVLVSYLALLVAGIARLEQSTRAGVEDDLGPPSSYTRSVGHGLWHLECQHTLTAS